MNPISALRKGPRGIASALLRRGVRLLEPDRRSFPGIVPDMPSIPSGWHESFGWVEFAVAGMTDRGNVDAMAYAMQRLPSGSRVVEIGSFCGRSTIFLTLLKHRYGLENPIYSCDRWRFEGQETDESPLGESKSVTHGAFRQFVFESFIRNVALFCRDDLPHTVELFSDEFFRGWKDNADIHDVFGRPTKLGGTIGFCFIDGNHSYEFAKRDFENTDRYLADGGFILFDDSADGSGWEVCRVVREVADAGIYRVVAKTPNYLLQKVASEPRSNQKQF